MMSTAMSRNLLSYSRAWCPQNTRSLPLASTTRTLASAPQRSQWKGTTRSSVGGVVVSVGVIWSSLALYRTDPLLRIGLLHSASMSVLIPDPGQRAGDSPETGEAGCHWGSWWSGSQGRHVPCADLSCCSSVLGSSVRVRSLTYRSHATPLTRHRASYTDGLPPTGEIVTKPQYGCPPAPDALRPGPGGAVRGGRCDPVISRGRRAPRTCERCAR